MVITRRAVLTYIHETREDETLMIHRNKPGDFLFDTFVAPGGGIEYGEKPFEAAYRETKEETGLNLINLVYRGTVLFDNGTMPTSGGKKGNQSVDIFCANSFYGDQLSVSESGPLVWVPNHEVGERSGSNGGDLIYDWLTDGRLFDARIIKRGGGVESSDVDWTSEFEVPENPYKPS